MNADVVVAGGGVIGTAIAWSAARGGLSVILVDPGRGDAASLVAAGMLGPVTESVFGEQDLLNLNLLAISRFAGFSAELEAAAGRVTGLRTEGTLAVAYDSGDLAALRRLTAFRRSIGLQAAELDARACRQLEPFLAPGVHGGVLATGDLSVDNRRYLAALREAARAGGVRTIAGTVTEVADGTARLAAGDTLRAPRIVVAAGWATSRIGGLPDRVRKAIRPVKGQILRLRHPAGIPPVITRTVRAIVQGRDVYLVPRADGELVVGATQEERDDTIVTAGAVHDLLRDAMTAVPAVSELVLAETSAGLRPGTQDNGPVVGRLGDGLIVAAGHFRNGILLSAATAEAVTAILAGGEPPAEWAPFSPGRFA
ncbi:MAG TPA: glycine oxidase ThiO [Trebonia sp.]